MSYLAILKKVSKKLLVQSFYLDVHWKLMGSILGRGPFLHSSVEEIFSGLFVKSCVSPVEAFYLSQTCHIVLNMVILFFNV